MKLIQPTQSTDAASRQRTEMEGTHSLGNKIIVIDDQTSFYELLCNFIEREIPNLEIVGLCRSADEVAEAIARTEPNLMIMGLCLPELNPREYIRKLKSEHSMMKILVMTHWKHLDIAQTLLDAGANGIISKQESLKTFYQAICTVCAGEEFLPPSFERSIAASNEKPPLSPREALALRLIADGYSTKEMADPLGISIKTAGKYRERIMAKLGINDSIKLTQFAIRNGYYVL